MSSDENEDTIGQFDAFRARQAEERAQQEAEGAYVFPREYEAPAEGGYTFPQEYEARAEPTGVYPTQAVFAAPSAPKSNRTRSVLIFVGAVALAGVIGLGAWLAFGSSSTPAASTTASGATASPSASPTSTERHAGTAFRVTIVSVGADSFTGTVFSTGRTVTVTLGAATRYGTKTHPFRRTDLKAGVMVIVRGKRTSTDTVTATDVTETVRSTP
jgi:hypothetical protein